MDRQLKDTNVDSPQPAVSSMTGLQVVRQQRKTGEKLHDQEQFPVDAYRRWAAETRAKLSEIFGTESNYQNVLDVEVDTSIGTQQPAARQRARLGQQLEQLDRLMELLETEVAFVTAGTAASEGSSGSLDIILVHGYDPTYREKLIHFLEAYGLAVRTVPTQPDAPTSVINAFVESTDIRFAIVLVTADGASEPRRPRPDAVLDLGFLLGRLGRTRVCALTEAGVALPGVDAGILCIPIDDDAEWQHRLVAELQAAGAMDTIDTG